MQTKKIPLRMCLGCGEMKPKKELVRVVRSNEGVISLDTAGRAPGRGAYICRSADCFKKAVRARRFEKAFSAPVPDEVKEKIERELMNK